MTVTEYFTTRSEATAHALTMRAIACRVIVSPMPGGFSVASTFNYGE